MKRVANLFSRFAKRANTTGAAQREFDKLCAQRSIKGEPWPHSMLYALLDHCSRRTSVRLLVLDRTTLNYNHAQTMLIGFDPDTRELLIDAPTNINLHALVDARDANSEVILQLQVEQGYLNITCSITDLSLQKGRQAYVTLTATQHAVTSNRRFYPRVSFSHPSQPIVKVSPDGKPALQFKLMDISRQGAKLMFQGRDIRKDITAASDKKTSTILHTEFIFNDHFTLPLRCELVQAKYLRTPGCHNQVRVKFYRPEPTAQAQLDELIGLLSMDEQFAA